MPPGPVSVVSGLQTVRNNAAASQGKIARTKLFYFEEIGLHGLAWYEVDINWYGI